jgi:GNAT superfamily N-acetyltransferase
VPDERLDGMDPAVVAESRLAMITAPEPSAVYVAEDPSDARGVRGYVSVGPLRDPERDGHATLSTAAVSSLYLDPPAIGTGMGGALHDTGVGHLVGSGFDRAILWIFAGNDRAACFYERRGWQVDSEPVQPAEWSAPAIRYARRLP